MTAPGAGYSSDTYGGGTFGESGHPYGTAIPFTEDYFLLAEDYALKQALKGIVVQDGNSAARPVGVWFGMPDPEIESQRYPYITVDLIDVIENRPQVQSDYGPLDDGSADYMQGLPPYDAVNYGLSQYGLSPMLLVYQISSWARQPRHDRLILTKLIHGCLHPRFGQIPVGADNTIRRVIVANFTKRDTTDPDTKKRLFRNIWTIQIPSEVFYDPVDLTARAASVIINNSQEAQNATLASALETVDATGPLYPGLN